MQERLKEMLLVQWPVTDGRIAAKDLEKVLRTIGYDYLITPESINKIKQDVLCKEQKDSFHQDQLIEFLDKQELPKYMKVQTIKDALKVFDFDNDGKIKLEEFRYFMEEFGQTDNEIHMNEQRLNELYELCKPLDQDGNIDIDKLANVLTEQIKGLI